MTWSKKERVVLAVEGLESHEEWRYFTDLELMESRGSCVCLTCARFTYTFDKFCTTLLICPLYQRLIPQGEHLTKRCSHWQKRGYHQSVGALNVLKPLYP